MAKIETIRVRHDDFPNGVLINAEDFDEATHTRFDEQPKRRGRPPLNRETESAE